MQRVIFSMSRSLLKWLGCALPAMPVPEGELKGRVKLTSDRQQVCWQCELYQLSERDFLVIAMEANSRFSLLLPFTNPVPLDTLLGELLSNWESHLVAMAINVGIVEEARATDLCIGFRQQDFYLECFQNVDLSVNGHINENCYLIDSYDPPDGHALPQDFVLFMEEVLNETPRRSKREKAVIWSEARFLKDGLLRFGSDIVEADRLDQRIEQGLRALDALRRANVQELPAPDMPESSTLH
ncbi:hypothetical protein [Pantoea sp. 1.19]|uniref:hypothetical protein n=1 Tax=Pantoea sp. 1.19 TaxID=1925589 RepID=UPI0009491F04|nr:hypothetical protein [Pantoea sp. 1.19]